jgi:hypothetical protein
MILGSQGLFGWPGSVVLLEFVMVGVGDAGDQVLDPCGEP